MTCIVCKGTKFIVVDDQTEICENCEGSGEVGEKNDTN